MTPTSRKLNVPRAFQNWKSLLSVQFVYLWVSFVVNIDFLCKHHYLTVLCNRDTLCFPLGNNRILFRAQSPRGILTDNFLVLLANRSVSSFVSVNTHRVSVYYKFLYRSTTSYRCWWRGGNAPYVLNVHIWIPLRWLASFTHNRRLGGHPKPFWVYSYGERSQNSFLPLCRSSVFCPRYYSFFFKRAFDVQNSLRRIPHYKLLIWKCFVTLCAFASIHISRRM